CARYQAKPTEKHLKEDSGFKLTGFSDADYVGCKDTFKSTFGGAQFLREKPVSWSSKKQDCTALSTAEAKYVSLSACCAEVLWMQTQLTNYGFHFDKIPIYCDSKSAIAISCNPVQHSRTKHIVVRYHFIKEHVEKGTTELYFVKTDYQLADIFTKALLTDRFNYLVCRLGFIDADHPSHVYKLKKALYGLKQAPRAWYTQLFSDLMKSRFEMSMMGEMTFFLGLQVNQSPCGIYTNQSKYVLEILKKYGMESCDPVGTPIEIKDKLDLDQNGTLVDATKYRSMIGALMYLTSSRPDSGFELTGFLDADYAGCKDSFKSTSVGAQFLGEKLVSWSSKKQDCMALSTAEAEYVSLSACCAQVLWMRTQLTDYGF
nr:retrovirus-related Pol polyprotein from transposon TNT 1-94 [Tanacetum cinerariifolium]